MSSSFDKMMSLIEEGSQRMFDINVSPKSWVLPNRAKFNHWIDETFKYDAVSFNNANIKTKKSKMTESDKEVSQEDACSTKVDGVELFSHQKFIKDYIQYDSPYRGLMVYHGLGTGKCHAKDTPIIMHDGTIKKVQDIEVGEKLMGDDSTARKVLSLTRGHDDLYEIVPTKGEKHIVNGDHILCLKLSSMGVEISRTKTPTYITRTLDKNNVKLEIKHHKTREDAEKFLKSLTEEDNIIEISVKDFIEKSSKFKSNLKLYRKPIHFPSKKVDFDPYLLGVWLGDGSQRDPVICNQDAKLLAYMRNTLPSYGLSLNYQSGYDYRVSSCTSCKNKTGKNAMLNALKKYNMINNKHIPHILKANDRDVRLKVLAGLIDTDGNLNDNCYEITQGNEVLMDDIVYVARSLGFSAYKATKKGTWTYKGVKNTGTYFRVFISGDGIEQIPVLIERKKSQPRQQKKDVLVTGFKINQIAKGDYYGFTVNKNSRYLLGDFTVTHNSCSAVAAAEIILKKMNVTVMLPASLKPNFMDEIRKCGNMFYKVRQEWTFIPKSKFKDHESEVAEILSLEKTFINKRDGVWVPIGDKNNFTTLSQESQTGIMLQIDNMIKKRFTFMSYNGWNKRMIEELTEGGKNPFDNQCVIIDEVHNLMSTIVNGRAIGQAVYKLLMNAKNCKLICLSGTPIINYPFEIAFLINLLTGPRKTFYLKASPSSKFPLEEIKSVLNDNSYVDYFSLDENAKSIALVLIPEGFVIADKEKHVVVRDEKDLSHSKMVQLVSDELQAMNVSVSKPSKGAVVVERTLPEDREEFDKYFIDYGFNSVKNPKLFMKRIIGTVSFYSTYSPELYPSVTTNEVALPMNDFQFPIYEEARAFEMKKESKAKTQDTNPDNPFANSGQVYRFYSRAICNFVFPEDIKRPFPSKSSFSKSELDVVEEDTEEYDIAGESPMTRLSRTKSNRAAERDEYVANLKKALDALSHNMHMKSSYLNEENIGKYSPKFKAIYDKLKDLHGNALIYSQFRKVEGLGVLGLVLRANGYAEFKVKKTATGEWDIDIAKEDYNKPKFAMFTGNNDESKILLKIFNSDVDTLSENIKAKLPLLMSNNESNNLHGSFIKVIMITQSGAEGISLKNVRQVHIVEPYWNNVRMEQVIGRAVRTCSHVALPQKERNVEVFTYYTTFSPELLEKSFTLRTKDKSLTTDEYIYRIAKRKASIIGSILDLIKRSAVDCGVNAKKHKNMKCFSFPGNIPEHEVIISNNIRDDPLDYQYESEIINSEWKGQVLKTKLGNYLVNLTTNIVYDYDHYVDSNKLIVIGRLQKVDGKHNIVRVSASTLSDHTNGLPRISTSMSHKKYMEKMTSVPRKSASPKSTTPKSTKTSKVAKATKAAKTAKTAKTTKAAKKSQDRVGVTKKPTSK